MKISQKTLSEMEHSLVAFRYVALSNDPAKELPAAKFHHELSDLLLNDRRNIAVEMFRESGKSSYALRTFPLHCLYNNRVVIKKCFIFNRYSRICLGKSFF